MRYALSALPLALVLFWGCSVTLDVSADATIRCASNNECPGDYECAPDLGVCRRLGDEPPTVAVSLTLPRQGDIGVSLSPTLIVAFNMDVDLPDQAQMTLVAATHTPALSITPTELANVYIVESNERLLPLTQYTFSVAAGIRPYDGVVALASKDAYAVTFTTTVATDITAPGPVQALVVERDLATNNAPHELSWQAPVDPDFVGTLVVRDTAPVTAAAENGQTYAVGQLIGTSEVVFVGIAHSVVDTPAGAGPFYYAAFAFDGALNYSTAVSPPIATVTTLWCPNGSGSFTLNSSDAGRGQIQWATVPNAALGSGTRFPASAVAFNQDQIVNAAPFVQGATLHVRPVAFNDDATYVGPSFEWWLSRESLDIAAPVFVELTDNAVATIAPQAWPSIVGEVDVDPAVLQESWSAASVSGGQVTSLMSTRGVYRLRARPVVAGCPDAAWSVSEQFNAGSADVLYVAAGASGDGRTAQTPAADVSIVLPSASTGTVIKFAAGDYASFTLKRGIVFEGGYAANFGSRSVSTYVSRVTGTTTPAIVANSATIGTNTVLDGFTLDLAPAAGAWDVVEVAAGASPTISGNIIQGIHSNWYNTGIKVVGNLTAPVVVGNTIDAAIAVWSTGGNAVIENNVLFGDSYQRGALSCENSRPWVVGNTIENAATAGIPAGAVEVGYGCDLQLIGNRIMISGTNQSVVAVNIRGGSAFLANNLIAAGNGYVSMGIVVDSSLGAVQDLHAAVTIVNNTIHVGQATGTSEGLQSVGIFMRADATKPVNYDIRIANNLMMGTHAWYPFAVNDNFTNVTVLQNNKVLAANVDAFVASHSTVVEAEWDTTAAATELCAIGVIVAGNEIVAVTPDSLFEDYGGDDALAQSLEDNNWTLATAAPASIALGGLTLGSGNNCGGASCGNLTPTLSCGEVTTDYAGATRAEPYSVGALD